MADKTYINGLFIKEFNFDNGGTILNIAVSVDKFVEELKQHAKNGYVNIQISKRKEVDKHGNTHYATLNTYEKKEEVKPSRQDEVLKQEDNDDLPF